MEEKVEDRKEELQEQAQPAPEAETRGAETAGPEVCVPAEDINKALAALTEKNRLLEEMNDRYKRLQADFDNFRRRTRQEKEELSVYVSQEILQQFLPVLDNFERALSVSSEQEAGLRAGIEMIFRQLVQTTEKLGVKSIEAVGAQFDPKLHEAVFTVEDAERPDGVIAEEMQKGYLLQDKVIRPSMVKVVKNN